MYQTMRCKHCGSELHWTAECPPAVRAPALRTCTVYARDETTEYVLREDHDRTVRDAQMKIANLELELRRMRTESDWRWYHDHIEAMQRRYEAELDLYRKPINYVPLSEVKLQKELREARTQIDVLRQVIIDMCRK